MIRLFSDFGEYAVIVLAFIDSMGREERDFGGDGEEVKLRRVVWKA